MTRKLRLTSDHLERFAEASGDRNPLHVDASFARSTPYGRCIGQGALVTMAALGIADEETLARVDGLDLQFKHPIFPGDDYAVSLLQADAETTRIEVSGGGRVVLSVTITAKAGSAAIPENRTHDPVDLSPTPLQHTLEELADSELTLRKRYACEIAGLRSLASDLGAAHVPTGVLSWLAAASYAVGMLIPGRDAVFVGARIRRASRANAGELSASVSSTDDRTGLVLVAATFDDGEASAVMTLQTFLRPVVPPPDRKSISAYLPPSDELADRTILVVGGSRGIGAAVSGALATQGADVWIAFARSANHFEELRREFGPDAIRSLQFDAEDTADARRAFGVLRTHVAELDAVVLCAAPPLFEAPIHIDAVEEMLRSLRSSVAAVLIPLSECLPMLSPQGVIVVMSSAAVGDPPEGWSHYVSAKAAVEELAQHCARHTNACVLIVRAPKTWTDSTNTPLGRLGAVAKEQVAAGIARWLTRVKGGAEPPEGEALVISPDELLAD